jgi:hypothetical protein
MFTIPLASILRNLGTSCIVHNSREPTTIALYLNVAFCIKFYSDISKIPAVAEFPDFLLSGMSVHFILYRKDKIRINRKHSDEW